MESETKNKLQEAEQWCADKNTTAEFMIQYMQYFAEVDLDCVRDYLQNRFKP